MQTRKDYLLKIFLKIAGIVLLTGCERDLDVPDYTGFREKLVIHGAVSPQEGVYLEISRLMNPQLLSNTQEVWIDDAVVWVHAPGMAATQVFPEGNGKYRSDETLTLQAGEVYIIRIHTAGYDTASASVAVPHGIQDFSVELTSPLSHEYAPYSAEFALRYREPGTGLRYYGLRSMGDGGLVRTWFTLGNYAGSDFSDLCNATYILRGAVFDNSCHTAGLKEFDLWVGNVDLTGTAGDEDMARESITFQITEVDRIYWEFARYVETIPTWIELLFAEPQRTPSNVENGYGMITGENIATVTIRLK